MNIDQAIIMYFEENGNNITGVLSDGGTEPLIK